MEASEKNVSCKVKDAAKKGQDSNNSEEEEILERILILVKEEALAVAGSGGTTEATAEAVEHHEETPGTLASDTFKKATKTSCDDMLLALGVLPVLGAEVLSIDQLKKLWGSTLDAKKNGDDFVANILFKAHE
ncbi:hypothetical protein PCANC_10328 [Puccinia coronata f. sp. avenae]|uniref:Uncharacterized protein n=1 Tax=Puccinia coronata f. sp. avenae TaxID=200324 RepID=A0A2N5VDS2_9BASI|nr:hypothetical protein PCANC_10328 [Puccinia coronata f. sp. avenae]PLW48076.1 hypothetical protein PCASD_03548 [Puccinia coronata f. sp. avenae]